MKPTDMSRIDFFSLAKAAALIQNGEIIGYPTDTIYGLGTNPFNHLAVEEIFRIKNREPNQQIILLVDKNYDLSVIVDEVNNTAKKLIASFWPGPLTLVFKNKASFSPLVTGSSNTVALRAPNNPVTLKLLSLCKIPITSTSANKSGCENPKSAKDVFNTFQNEIPLILDDGLESSSLASTVIDVTGSVPKIIREGAISKEQITKVLGISF